MADQTERAFQKQPTIFLNKKGGLKPSESRFFCNPGLGFKIPNEAKSGSYVDKKCPFTGKVMKFEYFVKIFWKQLIRFPSVDVFWPEWSPRWRWTEPWWWDVIISIMSRSTTDLRRDTRTCLFICLHASEMSRLETSSPLASAGNLFYNPPSEARGWEHGCLFFWKILIFPKSLFICSFRNSKTSSKF